MYLYEPLLPLEFSHGSCNLVNNACRHYVKTRNSLGSMLFYAGISRRFSWKYLNNKSRWLTYVSLFLEDFDHLCVYNNLSIARLHRPLFIYTTTLNWVNKISVKNICEHSSMVIQQDLPRQRLQYMPSEIRTFCNAN